MSVRLADHNAINHDHCLVQFELSRSISLVALAWRDFIISIKRRM